MKKSTRTALFLGRFQPFHLGHLWVVKKLSRDYTEVLILVGTRQKKGRNNPFTYSERNQMIKAALRKLKMKNCQLIGIPDTKSDAVWMRKFRKAVPNNSIMFSGNNDMLVLFRKHKFPIRKVDIYRGISGTKVRRIITRNGNWKKYVDKMVAEFLEQNHLLGKVRK